MRWVYLTVIILFVVAIVLFSIQNVQSVTLSFVGFSIRTPLAILTAVVYALGAITGGSLFAALRKSIQRREGAGSGSRNGSATVVSRRPRQVPCMSFAFLRSLI